jgi:hypothetical protein
MIPATVIHSKQTKIFIMSELEINKNKLHICLKVKTAHADKMVYNTVGIC